MGEVLKAHRMRCQMTQEFVAEALGVSRQAVSKWETGTADPSTSNLLALAKLFGVPAEELLHQATGGEYETIGIKGQRYKSGGEKPSLRSVRAHWARLYENGPASCEAGPCTKHFGFNKSGCLGAQLFSNIHLFTRSVL